jgi:hypothetical protein
MSYQLQEDLLASKVIHLDSKFGTTFLQTGTDGKRLTTNYIYNLTEPLVVPDNQKILISLYSATIPYSFYNLRTGVNDRFYISYKTDGDFIDCYFDLTGGNYNAFELIDEFVERIETNGAVKRLSDNSVDLTIGSTTTWTWAYDRKTLKYSVFYRVDDGDITAIRFNFNNSNQTIANMFGFYDGDVVDNISKDEANPTISTKCIDMNDAIHGLYVRQNIATKGSMDNENGTFSNILARIPITTNAGGVIFHKPNEATHHNLVGTNAIDSIGCKLTDDRNRPIDLNGLDWQMALLISFVENKTPKPEFIVRPNAFGGITQPTQVEEEPQPIKTQVKKTKRIKKSK